MSSTALTRMAASVLVLAAVAGFWSWLATPGVFDRLDWPTHACWLHGFQAALAEGVWQPRWLAAGNAGLGAPVFVFYSPGAYYVGSAILLFGADIAVALKLMQTLAILLLAASTFLWLRCVGARLPQAACAGLLTMLLPQLTLLSLRFNMPAAALALAVVPLVLLARERCLLNRLAPVAMALAFALLVYLHLLTAFQLGLLLSALMLSDAMRPASRWRALRTAAGLAGGCLLAAPLLLPVLLQGQLIHSAALQDSPHKEISQNLLFSGPGSNWAHWPEAAFLEAATLGLIALGMLGALRLLRRRLQQGGWDFDALQALLAGLVCCWLMTASSHFVYSLFEPIQFLQYGWRWQGLAALMLLRAFWAPPVPHSAVPPGRRLVDAVGTVSAATLLAALAWQALALYGAAPHPLLQPVPRTTAAGMALAAAACPRPTPEYRLTRQLSMTTDLFARSSTDDLEPLFLRGRGDVVHVLGETHRLSYRIRADVPATLLLPASAWPGWAMLVSAAGAGFSVTPESRPIPLPWRDHGGLLAIDLPSGDHLVEARVHSTVVERVSNRIAIATLMLGCIWIVSRCSHGRRRRARLAAGRRPDS